MEVEITEREKFLDVYSEFTNWLHNIVGFRTGHYWHESATPSDYLYSHYDEYVDNLYGVEHYIHKTLNLSIRFLRDRNEHKIMFIGGVGSYSKTYTIEESKVLILDVVRKLRDEELIKLNSIKNI